MEIQVNLDREVLEELTTRWEVPKEWAPSGREVLNELTPGSWKFKEVLEVESLVDKKSQRREILKNERWEYKWILVNKKSRRNEL